MGIRRPTTANRRSIAIRVGAVSTDGADHVRSAGAIRQTVNGSDRNLWNQLAESVIGSLAGALLAALGAARSGSLMVTRASEAHASWQRFVPAMRWQLIGT